jgi:hypothetical protein
MNPRKGFLFERSRSETLVQVSVQGFLMSAPACDELEIRRALRAVLVSIVR